MVVALVVVAASDRWAALVVQGPYRQRLADSHQLAVPCHEHEDHLARGRAHSQRLFLGSHLGHILLPVSEFRQVAL